MLLEDRALPGKVVRQLCLHVHCYLCNLVYPMYLVQGALGAGQGNCLST